MYVTFRRYKISLSNRFEIIRHVEIGFVPIVKNAMGFVNYSVFMDGQDHICSVSTFKTRAGMEEANQTAREWVSEHLLTLLPHPPEVVEGESEIFANVGRF